MGKKLKARFVPVVKSTEKSSHDDLSPRIDSEASDDDVASNNGSSSSRSSSVIGLGRKATSALLEETAQVRPQGVRLNVPVNPEACPTDVRHNVSTKSASSSIPSGGNQQTSLNQNAKPFIPGSVDAIFNSYGGPAPSPTKAMETSLTAIPAASPNTPAENLQKPINSPKQLPHAWNRSSPLVFTVPPEAQGNFKNNDGVLTLDEDEASAIGANFNNALVGRVIGKNFKFEWLASQLQAKWGSYPGFRVNDLGNGCFILRFADKDSRDRVWLGGPSHVAGYTVGLDKWTENFIPSKNPQMWVPTWVRFPCLPLQFWGDKNLWRIASEVGEPLFIDASTKSQSRTIFARICVRRNLAVPLKGGVWLHSKATGNFFQKFIYEGITSLCTECGMAGHGDDPCNQDVNMVDQNGKPPVNPAAGRDGWTLVHSRKPKPQNDAMNSDNPAQPPNVPQNETPRIAHSTAVLPEPAVQAAEVRQKKKRGKSVPLGKQWEDVSNILYAEKAQNSSNLGAEYGEKETTGTRGRSKSRRGRSRVSSPDVPSKLKKSDKSQRQNEAGETPYQK